MLMVFLKKTTFSAAHKNTPLQENIMHYQQHEGYIKYCVYILMLNIALFVYAYLLGVIFLQCLFWHIAMFVSKGGNKLYLLFFMYLYIMQVLEQKMEHNKDDKQAAATEKKLLVCLRLQDSKASLSSRYSALNWPSPKHTCSMCTLSSCQISVVAPWQGATSQLTVKLCKTVQ